MGLFLERSKFEGGVGGRRALRKEGVALGQLEMKGFSVET